MQQLAALVLPFQKAGTLRAQRQYTRFDPSPDWHAVVINQAPYSKRSPGLEIGFLYNHDACHQVYHTATVMASLSRLKPEVEVTAVVTSLAQLQTIQQIIGPPQNLGINVELALPPPALGWLLRGLNAVLPSQRIYTLVRYRKRFRFFDALVVPETTSTLMKSLFKQDRPFLIWLPHGAGDREIGFGEEIRWFDYVLLPGPKVRDKMLKRGLIEANRHRIIGYPKFDAVSGP